jgi:hypothetical protein
MPATEWHLTVWSSSGAQLTRLSCTVAIDPATLRGTTSSFGPSLVMPYEVKWYPNELVSNGAQMLSLEGWIAGASDAANVYGIRIPTQISLPNSSLVVPLTLQHIEAIENLRRGDALVLNIGLSGLAVIPDANVQGTYRIRMGYGGEAQEATLDRLDTFRLATSGDTPLRIEREHWLKILNQFDTNKRRLIELPELVIPNQRPRWDECVRLLSEATQQHRQGGFEQSLGLCRKAIEGIATVLGDVWHVSKQSGASFESWTKELSNRLASAWQSDKDAPKLLAALLSAAYTWTSPTAHYGSDIPVREESSFALSTTSDLLAFAAQLLNAHPFPVVTDKTEP